MNCPKLCPECPLLPDEVQAQLTSIDMITEEEMRDHKYGAGAGRADWLSDQNIAETRRLTFTVTESSNPEVEIGDTADELVYSYSLSSEQLASRFEKCEGPEKPGIIGRLIGKTALCNGIPYLAD